MADSKKLEKYLNDDSFVRWIIGKADSEESTRWDAWEKQDPMHSELADEARLVVKKFTSGEPAYPNPSIELKKLRRAIDIHEQERELWSFSKYEKKRTSVYISIAASIVLLTGLIFIYNSFSRTNVTGEKSTNVASVQEFQTDYGQKSTLKLSDGSRIILNANSSLKFASDLNGKGDVDIWLNGEAYFAIPHLTGLKRRVVRIHTPDGIITDLGTEFSVNSRSGRTRVALVEGHVRVSGNTDTSMSKGETYLLGPNELAVFRRGVKNVQVSQVSTDLFTSWVTDRLVCDHTPLQQIIERIENTYGMHVIVKDRSVLNKKLSGTLKNSDVDMLEKALSQALKLPVTQEGKRIYIGE